MAHIHTNKVNTHYRRRAGAHHRHWHSNFYDKY